jgi:Leucine-rich repeat (LRR) protein
MDDIFLEVVERSSLAEIQKMCLTNKHYNALCKKYRNYIAKIQLEKNKVDYKDPGNLIYKLSPSGPFNHPVPAHSKSPGVGYDPNRSLYDIFKLYQKFHNAKSINCSGKDVTSIPPLPELSYLDCSTPRYRQGAEAQRLGFIRYGLLTSLPEFPKLWNLNCSNNLLTSLPEYPLLQFLDCSFNKLTSLPMYPKLINLNFSNNQISSLLVYPELAGGVVADGNPIIGTRRYVDPKWWHIFNIHNEEEARNLVWGVIPNDQGDGDGPFQGTFPGRT